MVTMATMVTSRCLQGAHIVQETITSYRLLLLGKYTPSYEMCTGVKWHVVHSRTYFIIVSQDICTPCLIQLQNIKGNHQVLLNAYYIEVALKILFGFLTHRFIIANGLKISSKVPHTRALNCTPPLHSHTALDYSTLVVKSSTALI